MVTESLHWPDLGMLLVRDEAILFEGLRGNLPEGWILDFRAESVMVWIAILSQADASRNGPMFIICRWTDRVGLFVESDDGPAHPTVIFADLWSILDTIASGVFAFNQSRLANVSTEGWANTQH